MKHPVKIEVTCYALTRLAQSNNYEAPSEDRIR